MNSEKYLAYFIADILNQSPTKCLHTEQIYDIVEQRWEIPPKWNKLIPWGQAYNKLKKLGLNWTDISEDELKSKVPTELKWKNEVRQSRRILNRWGWLEENNKRGIWCLNSKGQEDIFNYINY